MRPHSTIRLPRVLGGATLALIALLGLSGCMAPKPPAAQTPADQTPAGQVVQTVKASVTTIAGSPASGRLSGLALTGTGPSFMAVGSAIMTSTDGNTWTSLSDAGAIVGGLDFASPQVGWAATDSGLLATHDGGKSWQQLAPGAFRRVDFVNESRGFAAAGGGLVTSGDGGKTWIPLAGPCAADPNNSPFSFVSEKIGWILCGGQPGAGQQMKQLFTTTDGGQHWNQLAATGTPGTSGAPSTPAASSGHAGLPGSGYVSDLSFIDPHHGWLSLSRGGVWSTTDGGKTWTSVRGLPVSETYLVVRFRSPEQGFAIQDQGGTALIATHDGGNTWQPVFPGLRPDESQPRKAFDRLNWLSVGDSVDHSAILKTGDGGNTWQTVGSLSPDTVFDISFPDPQHGWAITDRWNGTATVRTLMRTSDGGATWTPVSEAPADPLEYYNNVFFVDDNVGFVASQKRLSITLDGGASLQNVDETSGGGYQFQFTDKTHGWKIQDFRLYASTDGGKSWQPVGFDHRVIAYQLLPDGTAWVLGSEPATGQQKPTLFSTSDGGKTWIQYDLGGLSVTGLRFASAKTGLLSGENNRLYATEDGGHTWTQVR